MRAAVRHRVPRRLAALAGVSAFSALPPYLAALDVSHAVEVVDHVVPGALAAAAAGWAMVLVRRGAGASTPALAGLGICALAGLWETFTHVPLLLDAGDPGRPLGSVLLHATPGPLMAVLALWLLADAPA